MFGLYVCLCFGMLESKAMYTNYWKKFRERQEQVAIEQSIVTANNEISIENVNININSRNTNNNNNDNRNSTISPSTLSNVNQHKLQSYQQSFNNYKECYEPTTEETAMLMGAKFGWILSRAYRSSLYRMRRRQLNNQIGSLGFVPTRSIALR